MAGLFFDSKPGTKSGPAAAGVPSRKTLFREVNEQIRTLLNPGDGRGLFLCECNTFGCGAVSELTAEEWDGVSAHPSRRAVAPNHEDRARGRIVERHERFTTVDDPRGRVREP